MLQTWLRRWLGVDREPEPLGDPTRGLAQRVDQLEEHIDYLHGSLRKLRGRVTGGLRSDPDRSGDGGDSVSDAPPASSGSRQWDLARLDHQRQGNGS